MKLWLTSHSSRIDVKVEINAGEMLFEDVAIPRLALREAIKQDPRCMAWMGCKAVLTNHHLGITSAFGTHHFNSFWDIFCKSPHPHLLTITQLA